MIDTKRITAPLNLKADDAAEGSVSAVFSTFNTIDSDGDVVLPSAFTAGQAVPMVWSHDWSMPVGKGTVRVEPERAVFDGRFFLETSTGRDAYLTVKAMDELQEFSWGFQVLDAASGEMNGQKVRFIKQAEVFEVSPVLVGANRDTYLLDIKGRKYMGGGYAPEGSYEATSEMLADAFRQSRAMSDTGYAYVLATFSNHFIACLSLSMNDEMTYWDVPYAIGQDGTVTLGNATEVEQVTSFVPAKSYDQRAARIELTVLDFLNHSRAGSALRAKEGRAISTSRRERMSTVSGSLRTAADEIDAMLEETAPKEPKAAPDLSSEVAAFLAFEARMNGVLVGA